MEDGVSQRRSVAPCTGQAWRRCDGTDIHLLALIEAAQSSRSRLDALLAQESKASPELVFVLLRFAALLLSAGLRLPRRELDSAPHRPTPFDLTAPQWLRLQVV